MIGLIQNFLVLIYFIILTKFKVNKKKSYLLIFLLGLDLVPYFKIGSLYIGSKYIYLCFVILQMFKERINLKIFKQKIIKLNLVFIILGIVNTIFFISISKEVLLTPILGFSINFLIIFYLVSEFKKISKKLKIIIFIKYLKYIIGFNFIFSIFQLFFKNKIIVEIFYNFYGGNSSYPAYEAYQMGRFPRAFGIYSSPVYLGGILSLIFISLYCFNKNYRIKNYKYFVLVILLNTLIAFSKTAIILNYFIIPIIIFIDIFMKKNKTYFNISKKIIFLIINFLILSFLVINYEKIVEIINFYFPGLGNHYFNIETLKNSLDSRIGVQKKVGFLDKTINLIKEYPFGTGFTNINDEFIGDLEYITQLKITGFLFTIYYFIQILKLILKNLINKIYLENIIIIIFLLVGFSQNTTLSLKFFPFLFLFFNIRKIFKKFK